MKTYLVATLISTFLPPSFAYAEDKEHIVVDCAWVAGYLHGVAALRDKGISETALTERAEALVKAERWPDKLKVHITNRIHLMFANYMGDSQYSLSADYLINCMEARGDIPENGPREQVGIEATRIVQTLR